MCLSIFNGNLPIRLQQHGGLSVHVDASSLNQYLTEPDEPTPAHELTDDCREGIIRQKRFSLEGDTPLENDIMKAKAKVQYVGS